MLSGKQQQRAMDAYQKGPIIGEGTYGSVICATHKASGRRVAIKKVRMASGREGVNMSVLRELKALQALQGPHVVELLDVFTTKSSLVLVFEYMDCSLEDVIRDKATPLSPADVKAYMQMLLQGLAHVHGEGVVHRDVKPDNMLIGSDSTLKLADFGLARSLEAPCSSPAEPSKLTPQVFGRWYRPPELLMGCCFYGCPVDMWAAGCVLAELLLRRPWFPGMCDMDQLDRIFKALGVPTVQSWPGMADLPHRIDFKPADGQPLQQLFPQASPECLDLLQQLMQFDPQRRISAAAALQHPYFSSSPAPTQVAQLPRPTSSRGRRDVTVPAIMQDLLMRPAVAMRQQDGPAGFCGGGSSSSRQLFAFSGQHSSFSGGFMGGQGLQHGWPPAAAAGALGAEAMLSSGSRLVRSLSFGSTPGLGSASSAEQHDHLGNVLEEGPAMPWKGRLSFGSIADEPTAAAAGDSQQQQEQQQQHRRPSPATQQQQQQQSSRNGSMRPPLHRNPAAAGQQQHSGATPITVHVGSLGVAGGGSGDSHAPDAAGAAAGANVAPGNRRRVSDLAAASDLSSAAGASGSLLGSLLAPCQGAASLLHEPAAAGQGGCGPLPNETPAAALAVSRHVVGAAAAAGQGGAGDSTAEDADMACPMSMGTSAYKRSRAIYESAAAGVAGGMQQHDGSAAAETCVQQQQQQQGHGAAMSVSGGFRRVVRGRRISMGSGCCSMETEGVPTSAITAGLHKQQQQQELAGLAGLAGPSVAHVGSSMDSQMNQLAGRAVDKQQELEALLGGSQQQRQQQQQQHVQLEQQQQQLHQQQLGQQVQGMEADGQGGVLLQAVQPWQGVAASGPQQQQQQPADSGDCPMSLDQRATTAGRRYSMHSVQGQPQQQQCGHHATGLIAPGAGAAGGASSGCMKGTGGSSVQASGGALGSGPGFNTGGDGGLGFGGLAAMDPADLAELASWWRPRLDSAERRYLRCRKQQMDEALLQASQQDGEEARDNTLGSPEFQPRSALFGSPLGETPMAAAAGAADGAAAGVQSGAGGIAVAGAAAAAGFYEEGRC